MLAKRRGEGARFVEAQIRSDLRYGHRRIRQQSLGLLDPKSAHVAVRRQSEGLLERPHEMIRAQSYDIGQRCQRRVFRKVLLDILRDPFLLPTGKPPTNGMVRGDSAVVEPQEL